MAGAVLNLVNPAREKFTLSNLLPKGLPRAVLYIFAYGLALQSRSEAEGNAGGYKDVILPAKSQGFQTKSARIEVADLGP